jgi:hypothetical protein
LVIVTVLVAGTTPGTVCWLLDCSEVVVRVVVVVPQAETIMANATTAAIGRTWKAVSMVMGDVALRMAYSFAE